MSDGNNDLVFEIIDIFVVQAEELWVEMQSHYDAKNYEELGKVAHKAKSSVAILGMNNLAGKMKDLELSCRDAKNVESYQKIINSFRSDCLTAIEELKEYKTNNTKSK